MGNQPTAIQSFEKIQKLINSSRFNEALLLLKSNMKKYSGLNYGEKILAEAESTYRYMLDYLAEGHKDPSLPETLNKIRDNLLQANDIIYRENKLTDSSDIYSSTRRMEALRNTSFDSLFQDFIVSYEKDNNQNTSGETGIISIQQGELLDSLFNYVWTLYGENQEDYEAINNSLATDNTPDYYKSLIMSAIILGNLSFFNPYTFDILLNQFESSASLSVKAKALVGVLLIALTYPIRVSGNLGIRSRIMLTSDDEDLKKMVKEVLISILRTYDTKRIDDKMRNEVIPELMKIRPEIIERMRNLTSESEDFLSEENPQWEEFLENNDIGEKLQEINDMQLEGADVMVTAFSNLKSFPFFRKVSNWFMPFVPGNEIFSSLPIERDKEAVGRLTAVMCDSDLHSFLLSLNSMPEQQRNLMFENMQNQMKEAQIALGDAIGETEGKVLSKKIRHSLQDIYRFFKFFRKKEDFRDPFGFPFTSQHLKPLINVFGITPEDLKLFAEFYFKNKYFDEASGIFELVDREISEPQNWEKIGYCHERMRRFDEASKWFHKAELMNPESQWLIKKLAYSLKNSGRPEEALVYYNKALETDPENYILLMNTAQCLLDVGKIKEAIQHLYHAAYLKPDKISCQRALAWAEILDGNYDKASDLFEKIITGPESEKSDYLNYAHAALARGDFKKALHLYKTFVEKDENKDITTLLLALKEDSDIIKKLQISMQDLRLIVDKIRYDSIS